jgi:cellulose synthase/poly-beta-1,6-N-acetylglucosamine synthase-like glycosyltransferase
MITRLLFLSAGWFAISFLGLLIAGMSVRRANYVVSLLWLLLVVGLGDLWALTTFGAPLEVRDLSIAALAAGLFFMLVLRSWNAFGQVFWTMTLMVTALFIAYSFTVTAFSPLSPLSYLLAIVFFFIETIALMLALSHTYESLDTTTRVRWRRKVNWLYPNPGYTPKVSLHVPAYNEPPEVVHKTLQSLAHLDYPNFEVLVIDNNTPDEKVWRSLEQVTRSMGPRFRYLHLDQWPGFKSGALNFALSETAPDAEIIGTIDSDYELDPAFLKDLVPLFTDPQLAFVQTPQDYRDYNVTRYTQATYYSYRYFFEVSMPSRNEHNAIIFAGTMGLIRKSVLQEIGGWDEWCITEDAEASLRILKRGYQSLFVKKSYGQGLMPFTFDGLKKQRFRWCFGGIQILRKHWEALMPWARWVDPNNRMTLSQRYYYLLGGLQWYTDLFNLIFALFLVLGAFFAIFNARFVIRPLTQPLMIMPAIFLFLHMWRFLWVLRQKLDLSWTMALRTMYNFFSLGWADTLASIQGLIQPKGVFLRTPKSKSNSRVWRAVLATRWETGIGAICVLAGAAAFAHQQTLQTFFLALLLVWQASLYLSAPYYSLMSVETPESGGAPVRGAAVWEARAAGGAMLLVLSLGVVGVVAQFVPLPTHLPSYTRLLPQEVPPQRLLGANPGPAVPVTGETATPTPVPTVTPRRPSATPGSPSATVVSQTPSEAASQSATASLTGTALPSNTLSPSPTPSSIPSPTATLPPTSTLIPTSTPPPPTATLAPTITTAPSATPVLTRLPQPTTGAAPATETPAPTLPALATATPAQVLPAPTLGLPALTP